MGNTGGAVRWRWIAVASAGLVAGCMGQIGESGTTGRTGGTGGSGSSPASTGAGGGSAVIGDTGLPCDVQNVLSTRCWSCHTPSTVLPGQPVLVTRSDLMGPAPANPALTNAQEAVARMQSTTVPMPPAPSTPATAAEIATLNDWIAAGYPAGSCGADGGVPDPFSVAPTCTSNKTWLSSSDGSANMNPGVACIACHQTSREAPTLTLAGTVYPTAHEPDLCFGADGSSDGAKVVIVGADGRSQTLTPTSTGNFSSSAAVALPYQAKVVYMGRERAMVAAQTTGDCNGCHTQTGASGAPGRILLP